MFSSKDDAGRLSDGGASGLNSDMGDTGGLNGSRSTEEYGLTDFFNEPSGVPSDGMLDGMGRSTKAGRNRDHLAVLGGLMAKFPGNKISDFLYQTMSTDKLYLVEGLNCTEPGRFVTSQGEVLEYKGFISEDLNVWEQDIGMLQYLFGLYYTSVCTSGRRKVKYAVRDREYITGWDAVIAKPYEVSTAWLDLGMMCCYHHTGFKNFLDSKRWFYWVEEQTGLVLYRKRFLTMA